MKSTDDKQKYYLNKSPIPEYFFKSRKFIMNERKRRKNKTVSKHKCDFNNDEDNKDFYDTFLEKLKKENECTNISTTLKTKHVKNKFSNVKKIDFNNNNNKKNVDSIIEKVFDENLKEKKESENNVKLFLISYDSDNKMDSLKQIKIKKENSIINKNININKTNHTVKSIKNLEKNLINNIKQVQKNDSNSFVKCLLCCMN